MKIEKANLFLYVSLVDMLPMQTNASQNILHRGITRDVPAIKPTIESVEQEAHVL